MGMVLALLGVAVPQTVAGQAVILRNLDRIENTFIDDFGPDHVLLSNGTILGLDEVLAGTLAAERASEQPSFNLRLKTQGLEFARLKLRIANGDLDGAARIASKLLSERIDNLKTESLSESSGLPTEASLEKQASIAQKSHDTNYLLGTLAFDHHLKMGEREAALVAFIIAADHQKFASSEINARLNSLRQTEIASLDRWETFFDSRIQPIWFDRDAMKIAYRQICHYFGQPGLTSQAPNQTESEALPIPLPEPLELPLGVELYLASMEIQQIQPSSGLLRKSDIASRLRRAKSNVEKLKRKELQDELFLMIQILEDHLAAAPLNDSSSRMTTRDHPLSTYLRNANLTAQPEDRVRKSIADSDSVDGLIELLSIAANDGSQYPHLASASIATVLAFAKSTGDELTEQKLRRELEQKYPRTFHAKQLGR